MSNSKMKNATLKGGAQFTGLAGSVNGNGKSLFCGTKHTSKLRRELHSRGLGLKDTSGLSQIQTLLKVLQYLGPRGINTPEAVGCGFLRVATRIQELEEGGWVIASYRERIIGADGLEHSGIARYVLMGRDLRSSSQQRSLDLGGAA